MEIREIPRDILNYIVSEYIRKSDDFRNLSLSCKLFAEICRKNKHKTVLNDMPSKMFNSDIPYYRQKATKFTGTKFIVIITMAYYNSYIFEITMNLYTHGMDHLFVEKYTKLTADVVYDYEWGYMYREHNYKNGKHTDYKYYCTDDFYNHATHIFPKSGLMSQMPFVKDLNIKFSICINDTKNLCYDAGFIKIISKNEILH